MADGGMRSGSPVRPGLRVVFIGVGLLLLLVGFILRSTAPEPELKEAQGKMWEEVALVAERANSLANAGDLTEADVLVGMLEDTKTRRQMTTTPNGAVFSAAFRTEMYRSTIEIRQGCKTVL